MTQIDRASNGLCPYDNLTITNSTDMLALCGMTYNQVFRFEGPVSIAFRTDSTSTSRGFKLEYKIIAPSDDFPYQRSAHTRK